MTRIRRARQTLGITRHDLARAIGVSYQYMSQLEVGRHRPGMKTALKLAQTLDLSVDCIACDPAYSE